MVWRKMGARTGEPPMELPGGGADGESGVGGEGNSSCHDGAVGGDGDGSGGHAIGEVAVLAVTQVDRV